MSNIESAPRDGSYVAVSFGSAVLSFAYFENGNWITPQMVGKPDLGFDIVFPTGWVDIPTPARH